MNEMDIITGQCLCGKIKYKFNGPIGNAIRCHCSRCRKAFSGAGSAGARVVRCEFQWIQGKDLLSSFYIDNSKHGLGFCKKCGTTLVRLFEKEVVGITLGPLNDNPDVSISADIFVGSKACWEVIASDAPSFDEWPPKDVLDKLLK
jgi:hypothetical protein